MYTKRIHQLVADWDDVYKKGQLSLWILLALYDGRKYMAEINDFISSATSGAFTVKEQSLYRALRRYDAMKLVIVTKEDSPSGGPSRKYYELSEDGEKVLAGFIRLHITPMLDTKITNLITEASRKDNE